MMNERWLPYPGAPTQWFSQPWPQTTTNGMTQPAFLLQPLGTAPSTTWSASGTGLGINAPAGFAGNLLDLQVGGASRLFVTDLGKIRFGDPAVPGSLGGRFGFNNYWFLFGQEGGFDTAVGIRANTGSDCAFVLPTIGVYAWSNSANNVQAGTRDLILARDAANTLAQRNGTNAQRLHVYDTYTNSTDYHRVAIATARATLSSVSGASVTATNLIPAGAVVVGVTSKVTTGLGTSNGTTGYQVGTAASANRWGSITGTAAGTSTDNRNWTSGTIECFTAATSVIITANGGNFNGTGVIYVSVQYLTGESD